MKMPASLTFQLSRRAVDIARVLAPKDTGKGAASIMPVSDAGVIGMSMLPYMQAQNYGTPPRLMTELAGKTIPMRGPSGEIQFRTVNPGSIGKVKMVARDEKGDIISSKVMWQHPGIKAQNFVQQGIRQAVREWAGSASGSEIIRMLDESDIKFLLDTIRGSE